MESIEPKRLEKYIRLGLIFCREDPMEAEVLDLRKMCLISTHLAGIDFIWVNLEDADLRDADLDRADLRGTKLERSIWNVSDIQKIGLQLKPVHFNKILVNTVDGLIEVSKNELFSDEFILNQQ